MKVLITGVKGQLGFDVDRVLSKEGHKTFSLDRNTLDITKESHVHKTVKDISPDVVVHCAAYTNVDQAEGDETKAFQVNAEGTKYLAQAAESTGSKMIYISTDYVFDGQATTPYEVDHLKSPLGVYGKSKSLGEDYVKKYSSKYFIIRTAWVYGTNGNNFVKTMLKLAGTHNELKVVVDQKGSPTYTYDIATLIAEMIPTEKYGIYHGTNSGECTWYEFANEIFDKKEINIKVNPCTTEEFPRPAPRPSYSVLGHESLINQGFTPLRNWKDALVSFFTDDTI